MASESARVSLELKRGSEALVARASVKIIENLISATPRDTGWARANWLAGVDSVPDQPVGSRQAVTTSAQANGLARVVTGFRFGRTIQIANNVPYIEDLNNGSSPQASPGFVQTVIAKTIAMYARVEIK